MANKHIQAERRTQARQVEHLAEATRALGVLADRMAFMQQRGVTYEGQRDFYQALGYKRDLTATDFRERYERGGVAARVVEAFPKATWRGGAELIEDEDPETETAFEAAWNELAERLAFWQVMQRADILAGLGYYAGVLIGAPGKLSDELSAASPEQILYLAPYGEEELRILSWEERPEDVRYGMPLMYQFIRRNKTEAMVASTHQKPLPPGEVHWTRVLHIADGLLDDRVLGQPRMRRVWNLLDDLDKVTGAGAEAFWKRADPGLQLDVAKDVPYKQSDVDALQKQIDEYQHNLRRVFQTRATTINKISTDVADFATNTEAILTQISAGSEIPRRILTGSESGELASSQDRTHFGQRVQDRRGEMAEPHVRMFVDRLIERKILPAPADGFYEIRWPRQEDLTEIERVDLAAKMALANEQQMAATGEPLMTSNEQRDRFLNLPNLEESDWEPDDVVELPIDPAADLNQLPDDDDVDALPRAARARAAQAVTIDGLGRTLRRINTARLTDAVQRGDKKAVSRMMKKVLRSRAR